jgi:hypothetical protein
MLTYTIDKVGTVGFSNCWEILTWVTWIVLATTSMVSGIRLIWIPITWRARANEAMAEILPVGHLKKEELRKAASCKEGCNRWMERVQTGGILVGFATLILAHAARSHFDKAPVTYPYSTPVLKDIIERHKLSKEAKELGIKYK